MHSRARRLPRRNQQGKLASRLGFELLSTFPQSLFNKPDHPSIEKGRD
jgi:hypothetical protein